ncbi:MAG: helix-turn-helix transcriptional regulator [Oxalobacter sp.]|nr:helix-turn-helix transcriptional regulator [Oxalobacter sp.]
MAEKKLSDPGLLAVGNLIKDKRVSLGESCKSREKFIDSRSLDLFNGSEWISIRHLSNLELGKNWISIEMLLKLSAALEEDPVELFRQIIEVYRENTHVIGD